LLHAVEFANGIIQTLFFSVLIPHHQHLSEQDIKPLIEKLFRVAVRALRCGTPYVSAAGLMLLQTLVYSATIL